MSSLLGGNSSNKQSSSSWSQTANRAYDGLANTLYPTTQVAQQQAYNLGNLLNGGPAAQQNTYQSAPMSFNNMSYNDYKNSTGYDNQLATGSKAITNNAATSGLLSSGATLKALTSYGTGLADQNYANYANQMNAQNTLALNANNSYYNNNNNANQQATSNQNSYLASILGLVNAGTNAASALSGAGGVSQSNSNGTGSSSQKSGLGI